MIVEPGFFHHWKTRQFTAILGDPAAPLLVLKLWAHCQERKTAKLRLTPEALAAICGWDDDPQKLREALMTCGFIHQQQGGIVVHDWEKQNWYLVNAWKNGRKNRTRGYPVGIPSPNPRDTHPSNLYNLICTVLKEGVRGRFEEWVKVRRAMGKAPKDWDKMFSEQVNWLQQFTQEGQIESISASIRNNWQGLFPPKLEKPTKQLSPEDSSGGYWAKPTWQTK